MNICLPCCRLRLAGRAISSRMCQCSIVNEDLRVRVYARAAAVVREDRAKADAAWLAPEPGAPAKWGTVTGLKVRV